jgi:hypothetical protein
MLLVCCRLHSLQQLRRLLITVLKRHKWSCPNLDQTSVDILTSRGWLAVPWVVCTAAQTKLSQRHLSFYPHSPNTYLISKGWQTIMPVHSQPIMFLHELHSVVDSGKLSVCKTAFIATGSLSPQPAVCRLRIVVTVRTLHWYLCSGTVDVSRAQFYSILSRGLLPLACSRCLHRTAQA